MVGPNSGGKFEYTPVDLHGHFNHSSSGYETDGIKQVQDYNCLIPPSPYGDNNPLVDGDSGIWDFPICGNSKTFSGIEPWAHHLLVWHRVNVRKLFVNNCGDIAELPDR